LFQRPASALGTSVVLLFILAALFAPWLSPYSPTEQSVLAVRQPPSAAHWFGTDQFGRDVFSRVLHGARSILALTGLGALIAVAVGTGLGLASGYLGGWFDEILMRIFDSLLAIPALLLALVLLGMVGPSRSSVLAVLVVVYTPVVARVVRSETLVVKSQGFVETARLQGEGFGYILFREILPSILPALSVEAALRFSYGIFLVASLGFLGVGVRPPSPDWGLMVKEARIYIRLAPWSLYFPVGAISLLVVGVNLMADGLKRALQIGSEPLSSRERRRLVRTRTEQSSMISGEPQDDVVVRLYGVTASYLDHGRWLDAARDVSLEIRSGQTLGLVGESGSGKSTLALAIVRYLSANGALRSGRILLGGKDVMELNARQLVATRGRAVSLIPQEPLAALNPTIRIGEQIAEILRRQLGLTRPGARRRVIELLEEVQVADPGDVVRRYPHQLSGGMQQRVTIAMGLAPAPQLVILDEPTTGLDVTTEATILDLLADLLSTGGTGEAGDRAALYITHDLGVVSRVAQRVAVLYAGEVVEEAGTTALFDRPLHPYTAGLLRCVPRIGTSAEKLVAMAGAIPSLDAIPQGCVFQPRCPFAITACERRPDPSGEKDRMVRCHRWVEMVSGLADEVSTSLDEPVAAAATTGRISALAIEDLRVNFPGQRTLSDVWHRRPRPRVQAVNGVSLSVEGGQTIGLVGESGSGKTTLARAVLGLERVSHGEIAIDGERLPGRLRRRSREMLRAIQAVAQNSDQAFNPHATIGTAISRPLMRLVGLQRADARRGAAELLEKVGLPASYTARVPGQLSGGERQRAAIARASAAHPNVILFDEATSSLDVSVQARILNLLKDLQRDTDRSYLFITHDLAVVAHLADRIAVMYLGRLMEEGATHDVLSPPFHPYTEALLHSFPGLGRRDSTSTARLQGEIPSALDVPPGCSFHTRCPRRIGEICRTESPPWREVDVDHHILCHIPIDELRKLQPVIFDDLSLGDGRDA